MSFAVAAALGAAIWGLSPLLTQAAEPWDAESPYYFVSLVIAGVIVGLLCARDNLVAYLGIVVGQLIYMLVILPSAPLMPLGVVFLFGYGLFSFLGLFLASKVRRSLSGVGARGANGR